MKNFLRTLILRWLGLEHVNVRLKDVERHFITKRDQEGAPIETLADVPMDKREELRKPRTAGMSWKQRRAYLEATDGGTRAAVPASLPSTS